MYSHYLLLWNPFICCNPIVTTSNGLDKLQRKKDETIDKVKEQTTAQPTHSMNKSQLYFFCYDDWCSSSNC